MGMLTTDQLVAKKCVPCEGGVPMLSVGEASALLPSVPGWELTDEGRRIAREWSFKDFMEAIRFFNEVAAIAEEDGHHPDLHLVRYRFVSIELWTHAIGGLSENDFILAAKINRIS